jgi:prophage DNA circulation protein
MRFFKKEKIKVIIEENDRSRFEYMLAQFQYIISDIEASPLELMPDKKNFFCFLTVGRPSQFELVIEILNVNGFTIDTSNKKVEEILEKLNQKYLAELAEFAATVDIKRRANKTHPSLDKLIAEGNYQELAKIAKDVTYSPETIQKARAGLSRAVSNTIIKTIENVSKFRISVNKGIEDLLAIATDNDLKFLKQHELMLQAANVAFELCLKNSDAINNLIKISNLKNVDAIINLKAAAKFAEIALADQEKYEQQIKQATKELNIRWLLNLIEPLRDKLSEDENENIDKLIEHIKSYFS